MHPSGAGRLSCSGLIQSDSSHHFIHGVHSRSDARSRLRCPPPAVPLGLQQLRHEALEYVPDGTDPQLRQPAQDSQESCAVRSAQDSQESCAVRSAQDSQMEISRMSSIITMDHAAQKGEACEHISPLPSMLTGHPFRRGSGPSQPSRHLTAEWDAAAAYCAENHAMPIAKLRWHVPQVEPGHYAAALRRAIEHAPARVEVDFSPVELFELAEGSTTIASDAARELFELLFVGLGAFPAMCDLLDYHLEPIINKNPTRLGVTAGRVPGDPTVDEVCPKQKLLDLATEEAVAGRYLGPYSIPEAFQRFGTGIVVSKAFYIKKLGAISSKFRLVHNGSSQRGNINAATVDDYTVRLDHTAVYVKILTDQLREAGGEDVLQLVADVSKCYRRAGVRASDTRRYGLRVDVPADAEIPFYNGVSHGLKKVVKGEVMVYFDTRLPFGMSASVSSCVRVTTFMRDLVREILVGRRADCVVYIDDFCCVGVGEDVVLAVSAIRGVMERVGMPENWAKREHLSQVSTFLGVEYDLRVPSVSLPAKKQVRYLRHLDYYLKRKSRIFKRKELESITSILRYVSGIISQSNIYSQRLHAAFRRCKGKTIRVSEAEMDDLRWWRMLLATHSGSVIIDTEEWVLPSTLKIFTDASPTGYGVIWKGRYFHGEWDEHVRAAFAAGDISISELELVCLTFAMETWGEHFKGKRVLYRCDNKTAVHNVSAGTTHGVVRAAILRRLFVVAAIHGIEMRSSWISTERNEHADALSRADFQRFFSLPQHYSLQQEMEPRLDSSQLLTDPEGSANPSSPAWVHQYHLGAGRCLEGDTAQRQASCKRL